MLTPYDSGFASGSDNAPTQKSSSLERILQVVSIGSGIAGITAGIVSLLKGGPSYLIWLFVAFGVLIIITAIYKPLEIQYRSWSERRKDRRVAREHWPKFRTYVHRFGDFVSTQTNTTLHYIIANEVTEPTRTELNKLLVNNSLWYGFWHSFMGRVDRESPVLSELAYAVEEFHHLVSQYGNFCIAPIFERFPEQLRPTLTEQSKVKLNTFRERYGHFVNEYMAFAKQLSESRPQLQRLPHYLTYPTQL
jgi:hypothetical protein